MPEPPSKDGQERKSNPTRSNRSQQQAEPSKEETQGAGIATAERLRSNGFADSIGPGGHLLDPVQFGCKRTSVG